MIKPQKVIRVDESPNHVSCTLRERKFIFKNRLLDLRVLFNEKTNSNLA